MNLDSVMVTGANRGIGLEFVRQLVQLPRPPTFIFATYRSAENLQDLKNIQDSSVKTQIVLIRMDITDISEMQVAREIVESTVGNKGLQLLINNAGAFKAEPFPTITAETLKHLFDVNTVGPLMLFQVMLPLLEKAASCRPGDMGVSKAAVLNISSILGSIQSTSTPGNRAPAYKISKAALNMAMRVTATEVKEKGVLVIMMCPGWVKTDMGGKERAHLLPEESINAMLQTLPKLNETHHGTFVDRFGKKYDF